jgi:RNA 3'-terminal phosphate cyclase
VRAGDYDVEVGTARATALVLQTLLLHLTARGELLAIRDLSAVANLPLSIAEHQRRQALRWQIEIQVLKPNEAVDATAAAWHTAAA